MNFDKMIEENHVFHPRSASTKLGSLILNVILLQGKLNSFVVSPLAVLPHKLAIATYFD